MIFFRYLLPYLCKYKREFILGIISLICVDVVQLFIPRVIKLAIDSILAHNLTKFSLIKYISLIIIIGILMVIFRYFWRYYIYGVSRKIETVLRNKLFFHLQNLGNKFYSTHKIGDIMAHITNDIVMIERAIEFGTIGIIDGIVLGLLSFVFLLLISPRLTLYAFIPLPLLGYITFRFAKIIHKKYRVVRESFSLLTGFTRERFDGIRIIKAYACENSEAKKFNNYAQDYTNKNMSLIKVWGAFSPIIFCFAYFSICIVIWFGGESVILNSISIGSFVAFQMYLGTLVWPIIAIGMVINTLENGAASFSRINRLLEIEPEIKDTGEKNIKEIDKGNIEFVNVHFSYNGIEILKNINLRIKPGESIGVVGKVGSGKTTLLSLLPRLLEPTSGKILIDNYPIEKIPLKVLRKNIGFVPQENFLFSTTIKENIKFVDESISDEVVKEISRLVCIDDEIEEFDKKYDAFVGERGVTISGGQSQRISIARALLKKPKILILDNALSNVDAEKESEILKRLREIFIDKVLIVASHRIRSIKDFDRIIVLNEGEIAEEGTHDELLKNKSIYYNLFIFEELTM